MKESIMKKVLLAFSVIATTSPLLAQGASAPDRESIEAIAQLSFLLGEWSGTSTTMMGPGRQDTSDVLEKASLRAGGTALLLEGRGSVDDNGRTEIVHEALGIVTFDPGSKTYQIRAFRAGQGWTELEVDGRMLRWGMETPAGPVEFTLDFSQEGRWHETGAIHRGGQRYQFLEMDLERVP